MVGSLLRAELAAFLGRKAGNTGIVNPVLQSRKCRGRKWCLSTQCLIAGLQKPSSVAPGELAHLLLLRFAPLVELS